MGARGSMKTIYIIEIEFRYVRISEDFIINIELRISEDLYHSDHQCESYRIREPGLTMLDNLSMRSGVGFRQRQACFL